MPWAVGAGGHRIHWAAREAEGAKDAPWVVLVQGLGLSSRFWFEQPEKLATDAARPVHVLTLDNRGTGESDRPSGPYQMADMADDVRAVLDAAGVERATVVGISMGGMIAQHVAIRHPSRVAGLVLLATTLGLPHGRLPGPDAIARLLMMPTLPKGRPLPRRYARLLLPERDVHRASELLAHWPAALREHPTETKTFLSQFAAVIRHSTGWHLHRIQVPTVVAHGADDILVPPDNARRIAGRIPRAKLAILPDVGHAVPLSRPDIVQWALAELEAMSR
jgi:pimeloyl-ACP methyl ester carboxylesterase